MQKKLEESQRFFIMKRNLEVIGDNDRYPFFVFVFCAHVMTCELCELGERYTGNERVWAGGNEANLRLKLAIYLYGLLAGAIGLYHIAKFTTFTMFTDLPRYLPFPLHRIFRRGVPAWAVPRKE